MLCLTAFLSILCLAAPISSYTLIGRQPRLQDLGLSASRQMHDVLTVSSFKTAARVHNAIPIMYALLHCCCKSPAPLSWKGMLVAKLAFHFDININGICGNCCDSTIESVSTFGEFMTRVRQGLRLQG